jgi:hypothetical protein
MAHKKITKQFPGKKAGEIYERVDQMMERIAEKLALSYERDHGSKTGKVSKMGVHGSYAVRDGEVTVDLTFPMIVPGSMRQKVQEDIERKLEGLFG